MKIINQERQSGKTTKCIELLQQHKDRILITFSITEQDRLRELHPELKDRIIWWQDYKRKYAPYNGYEHHRLIVDNADYIIEQAIGMWVEVGTFNIEKIELRDK